MATYLGHEYYPTQTTTDGTRAVFGKRCSCVKVVWAISGGPAAKAATKRPFLTSAADCRAYIKNVVDIRWI